MKRVAMWFFLSCKRYMRKWSFLFILLLLPLGVLAAGQAQKKGSRDVNIAISVEESGENALGNALADSLVNRPRGEDAGMFRFYLCRGEEAVKAEVASRRAECGYVVYAGLEEKLDAKSYKRSIGVYSAPSTVAAALSTETVFAALMKIYNGELLADYVAENELFDPLGTAGGEAREKAAAQARELYAKWLESGSTFRFQYQFQGRDGEDRDVAGSQPDVFPVRGLVAVYVFVTGLYGAVVMCGDEERGLFLPLSYGYRIPCRVASMAAPAVMAGVSGLLALWAGGVMTSLPGEAAVMAGYCCVVIGSAWILRLVCRRPQVLCCIIPFLVIGSLVFCPVFVDAGRFFPGLDQVGGLFPPWYYLQVFR